MKNIMRFIAKYKIIMLIILAILVINLIFLLVSEISKSIEIGKKEKILKAEFNAFITMIQQGKTFKANMLFEKNIKNSLLTGLDKAPEKSKILELGYLEYIQSTDYMIEYYKKFNMKIIKVKQMDLETATIIVEANRPNYLKHMEQCDTENVDNANYNFNKAFIDKINSDKVEYIEGKFEINLVRIGAWKLIYSDQMKEMLYGKSEVKAEETNNVEEQ